MLATSYYYELQESLRNFRRKVPDTSANLEFLTYKRGKRELQLIYSTDFLPADYQTEKVAMGMPKTKRKNTCRGKQITEMSLRESRKEIRKREKALYESRRQARNRLFSLAYFTLVLVLASTIVNLVVYLQCRQMSMEIAISYNVQNFNISDGKCAKHFPDAHAASNLTSRNVMKQEDLLNFNLSDVKSEKQLPDAHVASNLTSRNVMKRKILISTFLM
ncbi:hypothetical protein CDAR_251891 [Caerostris darwini]|uniref:Uncharacterized protein n=1 Tax=Caerostris darwini TaxID=1538125 RepID=A0AAV4Q9W2_9ARAC|nr:hypothetical protein CDAR_251891 [Caerostris darwini]